MCVCLFVCLFVSVCGPSDINNGVKESGKEIDSVEAQVKGCTIKHAKLQHKRKKIDPEGVAFFLRMFRAHISCS